jgi:hypothetical protein
MPGLQLPAALLLRTTRRFHPHAQRIIEGKTTRAKVCVIDIKAVNTAAKADY